MAPIVKTDTLPAISLTLVKPASNTTMDSSSLIPIQGTTDGSGLSREQLMQMIYSLLMLVGENMSVIQNNYAKSQLDQEMIAQDQANATQVQTNQYIDKLKELNHKQEEAKKWGIFGEIMKWIGVAVGVLLGALLCETPLGFLMLAAVIAFTASPLFDKAVSGLGGAIGKAIGNSTWGNIIAQTIILVALTVLTCGAEGLSTGLSKLATTATEDVTEAGTQAGIQAAKQVTQEVETEVTEQITEEASTQASKASEQTASKTEENASKVSAKDFKPRWTYASASVFSQALMSTNIVEEMLDQIPGVKKHAWAQILVEVFAILIDLAAAFASFKGVASEGSNIIQQLNKLTGDPRLIQRGIGAFVGLTEVTSSVAQGGQSYNKYQQGEIEDSLAPLQSNITSGDGIFQILTQLTNLVQQTYKSMMHSNTIIFNTNFSADWQACVAAQQYQG